MLHIDTPSALEGAEVCAGIFTASIRSWPVRHCSALSCLDGLNRYLCLKSKQKCPASALFHDAARSGGAEVLGCRHFPIHRWHFPNLRRRSAILRRGFATLGNAAVILRRDFVSLGNQGHETPRPGQIFGFF